MYITGIVLSLLTSVFWSISPIFFAQAGQKIGSYSVNIFRLLLASGILWIIIGVRYLFTGSELHLPGFESYLWIFSSALLGLVVGDLLFFRSLVFIGPRRATQLLTLSPIVSVLFAWLLFKEIVHITALIGILLIVGGILYVITRERDQYSRNKEKEPGVFSLQGYLICCAGVICHGLGAVFARQAYLSDSQLDPFFATGIRVGTAFLLIFAFALFSRTFFKHYRLLKLNKKAQMALLLGTLAGPVSGMLCYMTAFKYVPAGIVSALSGLSPLIIMPIMIFKYKMKISTGIMIGTATAIAGVVLMSLVK